MLALICLKIYAKASCRGNKAIKLGLKDRQAASPDRALFFHTQSSQAPDTEHFILYRSLSFLHTMMQAVWNTHMVDLSAHKRAEGLLCLPLWLAKNQQTHCPMCVGLLTIQAQS